MLKDLNFLIFTLEKRTQVRYNNFKGGEHKFGQGDFSY